MQHFQGQGYGNGWNPNPIINTYNTQPFSNHLPNPYLHQPQPYFQPPQHSHQPQNPRTSGLSNLGNTCYMNSVLQVIFDVLAIDPASITQDKPVTAALNRLQHSHSNNDYMTFRKELGRKLEMVASNQQQDAHEFLLGLLETLNRENQLSTGSKPNLRIDMSKTENMNWGRFCDQMKKADNSRVIDIFGGELYTQLRCPNNHSEYLFERFLNISIPIQDIRPNCYRIQTLIINNFKEETLDGITCDECGKKTRKNKKSVIYNPPKVLVVNLKRFDHGFFGDSKINAEVAFDEELPLSKEYIHPDTATLESIYDLFAIVHHVGGLNGGHYYTQKKIHNQWLLFNDQEVTPSQLAPKTNISSTAYIFFYCLR